MNKRQVIVLWIIALLLATTVGILRWTSGDPASRSTQRAPGDTLLDGFPGPQVSQLEITGVDGSIRLVQKDGMWTVPAREHYPAQRSMVHELLRTLTDLKVTRGIEAGPSFAPRFGMDEAAGSDDERGVTMVFSDAAGKELAKVTLGKNIENAQDSGMMGGAMAVGRYIRNHADESGFYAVGEMFPAITTLASSWLDPAFLSPEKITSISLTRKGSDEVDWAILRDSEDAEFKLEDAAPGEVLDATTAGALKSLLSFARFEDVATADQVAERGDPSKRCTAVIGTAEGFTYRLQILPIREVTDRVLLTVADISATIPSERKKADNETPDTAKQHDEAFASRSKALQEKLARETKLTGRTFEVSGLALEALLKERGQLIAKAEAAAPGDGAPANVQQMPGGLIATPPVPAAGMPAEGE